MPDTSANLSFLPWAREGAAATIATVDTLAPQPAMANLAVALTVNGSQAVPMTVQLRGPADVLGLDVRQVVRMDPPPGSQSFEPNYFPCVEFDRPDYPWLFTPARADPDGRLRPWLCLVVVREQDGVSIQPAGTGPLPVLQIAAPARPGDELPDLGESWAWAHAQAAAPDTSKVSVSAALDGRPELSLSRLLCPRRLEANTSYVACVVPAFELGRKAGLGLAMSDSEINAATALTPAWSMKPSPPAQVTLPIYHQWRFRTGPGGDFESLVRQLQAQPAPPELGRRPIDISHPGFSVPGGIANGTALEIEGALKPMNAPDATPAWPAGTQGSFQTALAAIVNAPGQSATADPHADPLLAPTLYGRWYAARSTLKPGDARWLDVLNLDPRYRATAAFGTRVIQQQQEALMASAWQQAADLQRANQRLRQLQMSLAVGTSLHTRHLSRLGDDAILRVAAPAFGRVRTTTAGDSVARTVVARIAETALPVQAASAAMRRIGRQRGPLTRRVAAQGVQRPIAVTWIGTLNSGAVSFVSPPAMSMATINSVRQTLPPTSVVSSFGAVTDATVTNMRGRPLFRISSEGQPVTVPPVQALPPSADSGTARDFRVAASEHLKRLNPGRFLILPPMLVPLQIGELRTAMLAQLRPRLTLVALARAVVSSGANAAAPTDTSASAPVGIDTVMAAPHFNQPMYEALRDLSQDLLLPGLKSVLPDTVLGLKTNRRFVEAYMVGLNVEMGSELLWRGFPTDQRGTCFDQFWDVSATPHPRSDIEPLNSWGDRGLGDAAGAPAREQFVMLMRSALLRRYPNAIIYATPALMGSGTRSPNLDPAHELPPAFRGDMPPDVSFFGFDVTAAAASGSDGTPGYYIVIQEHPTEPRFGLDVDTPATAGTHVSVAAGPPSGVATGPLQWGRNAAHVAGIVRQQPVRIAIHASKFVAQA